MDADAQTLITAMSTEPDSTRQTLISDTITSLKDAGVWALLDECWFLAAHDEQAGLLGWKRVSDATAVNAPTFTTDRGFAGDGSTSYLNSNFTPSIDGVNYTLNDASFGVYSRTDKSAGVVDMGVSATNRATMFIRFTDNEFYVRVNQGTGGALGTNPDSLGLHIARRTASGATQGYKNGAEFGSSTSPSTGLPTLPFAIGCRNSSSPSLFSDRQYAFAFVAAAMSAQQQSDLFDMVESYMDSIGAGVVS